MREMFRYADKNGDGTLTLREVVSLLKHLNIEVDQDQARQIFDVSYFIHIKWYVLAQYLRR